MTITSEFGNQSNRISKRKPSLESDRDLLEVKKMKVEGEHTAVNYETSSILGGYDIRCPYIEREWCQDAFDFEMTIASDGKKLWSSFNLGIFYGIYSTNTIPKRLPTTLALRFRGRDTGENEIAFEEKSQKGSITFLSGGQIMGCIEFARTGEKAKFTGSLVCKMGDVNEMKERWEFYSHGKSTSTNEELWA